MAGKIFKSLLFFSLLWLVGCTNTPETVPTMTTVPVAESPVPIIPTQTDSLPILSTTPTTSPTNTPVWQLVQTENLDSSWYIEYREGWGIYEFSLYQAGESEPFLVQNIFSYYGEQPFESDIFETNQSPIPAAWTAPVWSPDGRYLAFLGAIDGPSSDLYVFDTKTEKVYRLTTGVNQAAEPIWSPDSQWIVHEEIYDLRDDDGYSAYWASRPDGSENRWLYDPHGGQEILFWADESRFYVAEPWWTGDVALRLVDLDANEVFFVFDMFGDYDGPAMSVVSSFYINPVTKSVSYRLDGVDPPLQGGEYISMVDHPQQVLLEQGTIKTYEDVFNYVSDNDFGIYEARPTCGNDPILIYVVMPYTHATYCLTYENQE